MSTANKGFGRNSPVDCFTTEGKPINYDYVKINGDYRT